MARLPGIVIPDVPHHVAQRGNRRMSVFFCDEDRCEYLRLIARAAADGLRATLGEAHRRYTRMVNFREGWPGHLFQSRFASYPMDDAHVIGRR